MSEGETGEYGEGGEYGETGEAGEYGEAGYEYGEAGYETGEYGQGEYGAGYGAGIGYESGSSTGEYGQGEYGAGYGAGIGYESGSSTGEYGMGEYGAGVGAGIGYDGGSSTGEYGMGEYGAGVGAGIGYEAGGLGTGEYGMGEYGAGFGAGIGYESGGLEFGNTGEYGQGEYGAGYGYGIGGALGGMGDAYGTGSGDAFGFGSIGDFGLGTFGTGTGSSDAFGFGAGGYSGVGGAEGLSGYEGFGGALGGIALGGLANTGIADPSLATGIADPTEEAITAPAVAEQQVDPVTGFPTAPSYEDPSARAFEQALTTMSPEDVAAPVDAPDRTAMEHAAMIAAAVAAPGLAAVAPGWAAAGLFGTGITGLTGYLAGRGFAPGAPSPNIDVVLDPINVTPEFKGVEEQDLLETAWDDPLDAPKEAPAPEFVGPTQEAPTVSPEAKEIAEVAPVNPQEAIEKIADLAERDPTAAVEAITETAKTAPDVAAKAIDAVVQTAPEVAEKAIENIVARELADLHERDPDPVPGLLQTLTSPAAPEAPEPDVTPVSDQKDAPPGTPGQPGRTTTTGAPIGAPIGAPGVAAEEAPAQPGTIDTVEQARSFLVETSRRGGPGATMSRQGVENAIGRLNPEFAMRLAQAIQQARREGINAYVFSAYRSPDMGANPGFATRSLHGVGAAVDMQGIGRAGSREAERFHEIARQNGVLGVYGSRHAKEWNHFQLIPQRQTPIRYGRQATPLEQMQPIWERITQMAPPVPGRATARAPAAPPTRTAARGPVRGTVNQAGRGLEHATPGSAFAGGPGTGPTTTPGIDVPGLMTGEPDLEQKSISPPTGLLEAIARTVGNLADRDPTAPPAPPAPPLVPQAPPPPPPPPPPAPPVAPAPPPAPQAPPARTAPPAPPLSLAPSKQDVDRAAKEAERAAMKEVPDSYKGFVQGPVSEVTGKAAKAAAAVVAKGGSQQEADRAAREVAQKELEAKAKESGRSVSDLPGFVKDAVNKGLAAISRETAKMIASAKEKAAKAAEAIRGPVERTVGDLAERDPTAPREVTRTIGDLAERDPTGLLEAIARTVGDLAERDPTVDPFVGPQIAHAQLPGRDIEPFYGPMPGRSPGPDLYDRDPDEPFVGPQLAHAQLPGRDIEPFYGPTQPRGPDLYDRDPDVRDPEPVSPPTVEEVIEVAKALDIPVEVVMQMTPDQLAELVAMFDLGGGGGILPRLAA